MTFPWRRREERGAIIIMTTVGIVLAVIAAALAVDLGRIAEERRRNQKVADLAALDASRDLTQVQALAVASAARNGFIVGNGNTIVAVEGVKTNGQCVTQAGSGKACVTVSSSPSNVFRPGGANIVTRAVAGRIESAGFRMGSTLASVNLDTELPLMNGFFKALLAPSGNINLLSYQGLAAANVKVRDLQAALGFGTLNELLTTNITAADLLNAAATVLNNQGTVASYEAATKLITLRDATTNSQTFKLGDYLVVAQGMENKAAETQLNVFELITAGAQLANGTNLINAGSVMTLPVTGVGNVSTKLSFKVIEGMQRYIGPENGPAIHTGQVEVTLTPVIDANFTALGGLLDLTTVNLHMTGELPVKFEAAGADGTLKDVRCSSPQGITVRIVSQPVKTSVSATLNVLEAGVLDLLQTRATVNVSPTPVTTPAATNDLDFAWPNEFTAPGAGKTTPSALLGVSLSTSNVTTTATLLGLPLGVTVNEVTNAVLNPILTPILNSVIAKATSPVLKALGLSVGPVDVQALAEYYNPTGCGQPGLLG